MLNRLSETRLTHHNFHLDKRTQDHLERAEGDGVELEKAELDVKMLVSEWSELVELEFDEKSSVHSGDQLIGKRKDVREPGTRKHCGRREAKSTGKASAVEGR